MNKKLNRLFPKVVGVYTFDNHSKYEKELVSKCDNIKDKGTDIGGQNWISQSVYNTENVYDVNKFCLLYLYFVPIYFFLFFFY